MADRWSQSSIPDAGTDGAGLPPAAGGGALAGMGGYEQSPDYGGRDPKPWLWVLGALVVAICVVAYRLF